jgi:hypothetical protein
MKDVIDPNQRDKWQIPPGWQLAREGMAESTACFRMGVKESPSNGAIQELAISNIEVAHDHDRFNYSLNTLQESSQALFLFAGVKAVW